MFQTSKLYTGDSFLSQYFQWSSPHHFIW